MVCHDYRDKYPDRTELQERLDRVTQFLCYMCGTSKTNRQAIPEEIQRWWAQHESADRDRVYKEMHVEAEKREFASAEELAAHFIQRAEKVHPVSPWHRDWFRCLADRVLREVTAKRRAEVDKNGLRAAGLAKLTPEERRALGL